MIIQKFSLAILNLKIACLMGLIQQKIIKMKNKYLQRRYGAAFDGASFWSFVNYFASNVVIFGVDNSSPTHNDNYKNSLLQVLSKRTTDDINDSAAAAEKKFSVNFRKSKTKLQE